MDTVTVVRHLTDTGHIGTKTIEILNEFDNHFLISVVSLMEILYLSEKHRIEINLAETLNRIESSSLYSVVDLTPDILKVAEITPFEFPFAKGGFRAPDKDTARKTNGHPSPGARNARGLPNLCAGCIMYPIHPLNLTWTNPPAEDKFASNFSHLPGTHHHHG